MTLSLQLPVIPSRFRRRSRSRRNETCTTTNNPNAARQKLSSSASASSTSSSCPPPLPVIVPSETPETMATAVSHNAAELLMLPPPTMPSSSPFGAGATSSLCASTSSITSSGPPPPPHLAPTTSTTLSSGTQLLEDTSNDVSRPVFERGGTATDTAFCNSRRSSWRSSAASSMRSIDEDAVFVTDEEGKSTNATTCTWDEANLINDAHISGDGNSSVFSSATHSHDSSSRFPFRLFRAASDSSLTSTASCPVVPSSTNTNTNTNTNTTSTSSSSPSSRERREEKIRRKNFEARRREFATLNPRRMSNDCGSVGSGGSSGCDNNDPMRIRRRRESIDFLRQESQAAALCGDDDDLIEDDDDDGCCHHEDYRYQHRGEHTYNTSSVHRHQQRLRSSSLDDSSDQRLVPTTGRVRRATLPTPSDPISASRSLLASYQEQVQAYRHSENGGNSIRHESPTMTAVAGIRRLSMPVSITEEESDDEGGGGSRCDSSKNGSGGLLDELEGRGLLKVQHAGLTGSRLYYDTEHRRQSY